MKTENIKSIYIRPLEGREIPSKADILKGIASKDIKEKEKSLNFLIINIINDQYYEQNIMTVINHIIPYQSKSVMLKKLVLIYWEIIQKRKHNGVVLDEFLLVCNNLRNDLNHANEFVVGATLKLIGRIAINEIIDSLIVPIYENALKHIESFVRRNAVECLYELFCRFGEEVITDCDQKMIELLSRESDMNTKRNAIVLLFKVNPEAAADYVFDALQADGIGSFNDIIQLVIVRNLFELCKSDPNSKSKFLKLILEFIHSPFYSVLFELGNSIAEFSSNSNVISSTVCQMVRILQELPDVSIKLIILQKLFFFKSLSSKYIEPAIPECLKLLSTENTEVRIKIIKLIEGYVNQSNVDEFLVKMKALFLITNDPTININLNDKLKKNLLKSLIKIIRQKNNGKFQFKEDTFKEIFVFLIENDHKRNSNITLLKSFFEIVLLSRGNFKTDFLKIAVGCFLSIQNSEVLITLFTLVRQEIDSATQAESVFEVFSDLNAPLKELVAKTISHSNETVAEIKKVQTFKTVIKEDGSYGTEIAEETSSSLNVNLENSRYKFLILMLSSNNVLLINFFRNLVNLAHLLDKNSTSGKKAISNVCLSIFLLYNYKQKEANQDEFVFTELNQLVKELLNDAEKPMKIPQKKMSLISNSSFESKQVEKSVSQFDNMLNFRILKFPNQHAYSHRF